MSCRDICLKKINPGGDISRCRVPPVRKKNILNGSAAALKAEVEAYRVAARSAPAIDHRDVKAFTEAVLEFWRKSGNNMPVWRKAARIVLAMWPSRQRRQLQSAFSRCSKQCLARIRTPACLISSRVRSCCATTSVVSVKRRCVSVRNVRGRAYKRRDSLTTT